MYISISRPTTDMPGIIERTYLKKAVYIISVILFTSPALLAQTLTISGHVTNVSGAAVPQTTVNLFSTSGKTQITKASEEGIFQFQKISPGRYSLSVTSVGFVPVLYGPFTIKNRSLFIPEKSIQLVQDTTRLNEINVESRKSPVEIKPGKTVINVDKSLYSGSALDMIARAPGVVVNPNGTISLKGKQGVLLMIDGKPAGLNADNMTELLLGIQSTAIDQIELMTTPPARYDAAGSAGVINIKLKKGTDTGLNGTVTAGFGYGNFYKSNTGFTLNNRTKKVNLYGSYNYGDNKRQVLIDLNRNILQPQNIATFDAKNRNVQVRKSHTVKAGIDYFISEKSTIGLSLTGNYTDFNAEKNNRTLLQNNFRTDSNISTIAQQARQLNGTNFAANYNAKLDTSGTVFNAEAGYFIYNRTASELQNNQFLSSSGVAYRSPAIYQIASPSDINIYTASADIQKPTGKNGKLDAGVKFSRSVIDNRFDFAWQSKGVFMNEPSLSNTFNYHENIYAGYLNYHFNLAKTVFDAGLRGEYTWSKGISENASETTNRKYFNLFPNVVITHEFDKQNQLTFTYNRRINRPLYSDLNPFINFLDPYTYNQGNPLLKPEYAQNIELAYQVKIWLITARYGYTNNLIYNLTRQNDLSRVLVSSFLNLGKRYQYGLEINTPFEISEAYTIEANIEAGYVRFTGVGLDNSSPNAVAKLSQNFNFGHDFTAEIVGNYETPTVYGINNYKALYSADFAMGKSFLQKRLQLKLSLTDIFNSYRDRFYTSFQNLDLRSVEKAETRIGRISLSYKFGKGQARINKLNPSNQEEQQRVGQ